MKRFKFLAVLLMALILLVGAVDARKFSVGKENTDGWVYITDDGDLRLGNDTLTRALTAPSISLDGDMEVNGVFYADTTSLFTGVATFTAAPVFSGGFKVNDDVFGLFGTDSDAGIIFGTTPAPDTLLIGVSASRNVVILDKADSATALSWAVTQTDPSLMISKATPSDGALILGPDRLTFRRGAYIDEAVDDQLLLALSTGTGYVQLTTGNLWIGNDAVPAGLSLDGEDLMVSGISIHKGNAYFEETLGASDTGSTLNFNAAAADTRWTGSSATTAFRLVTGYGAVGDPSAATQTLSGPDLFVEEIFEVKGVAYLIAGAVSDAPFTSSTAAANLIDLYSPGADLAIETASGNDIVLSPGANTDVVKVDAGSAMVGVGTPDNSLAGGGAVYILNGLEVDGEVRLDNFLGINPDARVADDAIFFLGDSETAGLMWSKTQLQAYIGVDTTTRVLLIGDLGDDATDLAVPNQGDPAIVLANAGFTAYGAYNADTIVLERGEGFHNQVDNVLSVTLGTGTGVLRVPTGNIVGGDPAATNITLDGGDGFFEDDLGVGDDLTVGGAGAFTGDITAAGGFRSSLAFLEADVGSGWANATADVVGSVTGGVNMEYTAPRAGSITGIAISGSAACATGTGTFAVTINGVSTGLTATIDSTGDTQYTYTTQAKDADTFAAGDAIGAFINTDTAWAESNDYVITVELEM